ncbi:MAG: DUF2892 domain-containing protein [Candidatus Methanoperedens sp.]
MEPNEGTADRAIRLVLGIALLYAYATGMVSGILMYVLLLFGLMLLVTGLVGYCPLYPVLKVNTTKK